MEPIVTVTEEILSDEIHYGALWKKLQDFKSLLLELTELDLEEQGNRGDLQFENGIALSTTFAALCVVDIMRTRQFVRGVFQAVRWVRKQKAGPVRILYAGTGPFATLVLPLLTKFNADELQLLLLEVNEQTLEYLGRLLKRLKVEDYVEKLICADASKYRIDKEADVDILVSETMQYALLKEQQVPIMFGLVNQLREDTIVIPNRIKLELALQNDSAEAARGVGADLKYKRLKTLWEFDRKFVQEYLMENPALRAGGKIELCKRFPFRDKSEKTHKQLVILTAIQVWREEWIKVGASSLTIPMVIFDLEREAKQKKEITVRYVLREKPGYEYILH